MLGAVLAHGLGRRFRFGADTISRRLVPVAAEFFSPVRMQVTGKCCVVLSVVYLVSLLIYIIVVLSQVPNLDHAAEPPKPTDSFFRDSLSYQVQMEAIG